MSLRQLHSEWEKKSERLILKGAAFEELLQAYYEIYEGQPIKPVYWPSEKKVADTNIDKFSKELGLSGYKDLHKWSIQNRGEYWTHALDRLNINFDKFPDTVLGNTMDSENPEWCSGGLLNIANSIFNKGPNKVAIIQGIEGSEKVRKITYRELDHLSSQVANGLINQGFVHEDRCAIFMPFNIESVAIYLGIVKAGLTVVSIADSFSANELESRLQLVNTKILFTSDFYTYGGKKIDVISKSRNIEIPKVVVKHPKTALLKDEIDFNSFLGSSDFESRVLLPEAISNILFSSGTTKEPKAIPWTHLTPIKCAADAYFHQDVRSSDVITWTTGMGWMMAPWLIYAGLINGASVALWEGAMNIDSYANFIKESKISILGTIPSLVRAWRGSKIFEKSGLNVRLFSSTGEPSNEEDYFYLMSLAKFKAPIIEYCGGTEIGGGYITGTCVQPCAPATFTTPALGIDFKLVDRKEVFGSMGEVFLIPPSIGLSEKLLNRNHHDEYYDHKINLDGMTLRKHGDAYEIYPDTDGFSMFYKCKGRTDDSMNLGGIKVSAIEIEEVVNSNVSIMESAAVGYSVNDGPEGLYIFTTSNVGEHVINDLNRMIAKKLNPLFRISEVIQVDKLPRTASNKLMRRELKERLKLR